MSLLRDVVGAKKKRLFSTEEMATILLGLTVGTDDCAGLDRLKEEIDDIASDRMSREVARRELVFLKLSAVFCALTAEEVRALHGSKADLLAQDFLAHFKGRMEQGGPEVEEAFLELSEARLAAYDRAFQVWRDDPEHRNCFAIGQAFFDFCGAQVSNPATLFRVHLKFTTLVAVTHRALLDCKLR